MICLIYSVQPKPRTSRFNCTIIPCYYMNILFCMYVYLHTYACMYTWLQRNYWYVFDASAPVNVYKTSLYHYAPHLSKLTFLDLSTTLQRMYETCMSADCTIYISIYIYIYLYIYISIYLYLHLYLYIYIYR